MILELKVDHTPEEAIWQIKDKEYILRFQGKLGEALRYTGQILAVGIGYDRKTKKHCCISKKGIRLGGTNDVTVIKRRY